MPLEVALLGHVIVRSKKGCVGPIGQRRLDLGERPDVEFALLTLEIGVEGCAERTLPGRHFAREPGDGFGRPAAEECVAGALIGDAEQFKQKGIVVEHLLEMRH